MGYVFLAISLLTGAVKGYCGKKTSRYTEHLGDAVLANCIRMFLCILIGFVIAAVGGDPAELRADGKTLLISALSGISTSVFVVSWLVSVRKSVYMLVEVFLMLGVLVPLLCSKLLFGEDIRLIQWLGIAVLFAAVLLMCAYGKTVSTNITLPSLLLLLLCGISAGISDFSQKLFAKLVNGQAAVFNFYTYVFAAAALLIALLILRGHGIGSDFAKVKQIALPVAVMAVCLFLCSLFKTLAAEKLDAVLLYPLSQGCSLILSSLMAVVLFREKLSIKAVIGICTAFAGIIMINLL